MTRLTARTHPRRCQRPGASAGESQASLEKRRESATQSQARPKKSRAPRKGSHGRFCRVPRSAGKESRFEEKEPSSDEKEPCEALWGVERGSSCPALGTESVVVGTARSRAWHFGTGIVPDIFPLTPFPRFSLRRGAAVKYTLTRVSPTECKSMALSNQYGPDHTFRQVVLAISYR